MLEPVIVVLRFVQYAGAMVLMGSSLFFIYALPRSGPGSAAEANWPRRLLVSAGALLAIAALLGVAAQASLFAGSISEGIKPETLMAVFTGMDLGRAAVVRAIVAATAVCLLVVLRPGRPSWITAASLGTAATASLAWMGHGAAAEGALGAVHLVSDILHAIAAAAWIGALFGFCLLLFGGLHCAHEREAAHVALRDFSGIGSAVVAVLVVTGLANSWVLVGPENLEGLWTTPYGRLLSLKLLLFVAMLGFAAANRYHLTPGLARVINAEGRSEVAVAALRRSLVLETGLGAAVLLLVAWFGTLVPPVAG